MTEERLRMSMGKWEGWEKGRREERQNENGERGEVGRKEGRGKIE